MRSPSSSNILHGRMQVKGKPCHQQHTRNPSSLSNEMDSTSRLASIISNFEVLQSAWVSALQVTCNTEAKARIQGVSAQMTSFQFLFGAMLGALLWHTDNLSRTLQHKTFSAAEGQEIAMMTVKTLKSMRSDEMYDIF